MLTTLVIILITLDVTLRSTGAAAFGITFSNNEDALEYV